MTPAEIKRIDRIIAVLEAAKKDDAIIESREGSQWTACRSGHWDFYRGVFRVILPGTPKKVSLTKDDWVLPSGQWWVISGPGFSDYPSVVSKVDDRHVFCFGTHHQFQHIAHFPWLRSKDGGQNWEPCWKEIPGEGVIVSTEEEK